MTEARKKNHTDCVDISSRTPRGQLMRQAVTYTHQAGAGGTNAPLPSRKKISLLLCPHTYREKIAVFSEIHAKHVTALWAEHGISEC